MVNIAIEGLREFRAALREAEDAMPIELTVQLKGVGQNVAEKARATVKSRSGELASGYQVQGRAGSVAIVSTVPYAGVEEFGTEWNRGGPRPARVHQPGPVPRHVQRVVDEEADQIAEELFEGVMTVASAHGWL